MIRLKDMRVRDPFVLPVPAEKQYYLFGSTHLSPEVGVGFDFYRSSDLVNWDGPMPAFRPPVGFWSDRDPWAPEVHSYQGKYYMFASFKNASACRGTQILIADKPEGPYRPHSPKPVTPPEWECLDGTLMLSIHVPNCGPDERPKFFEIKEQGGWISR